MFERSLSDIIKGLRSHRGKDEAKFVANLMDEIRNEVRSGNMDVKAGAVLKLTYLQMLGYPASNSSFHMLEVMASPRFHLKQIGYLAGSQCFNQETDVLILATNMVKKDLRSSLPLDVSVALNGLSHIVTPDLAQHLAPDIIALLNHSRPSIRKKAILVLYSIILKYPEALQQSWDRLSDKLEDSDIGVVSATINVICELARQDPQVFLPLSPQLFHLLTNSTNNWMLIKIIKLFGALTPHEPRLVRKLLPPITTIIGTTPAMSLLYECIHTVIIGGMLSGPGGDDLAATCVEKLATFLDDDDQNLKYISLLALAKILPTHPHLVAVYQHVIFESVEDADLSIRLRALDLVSGMATRTNLKNIIERHMSHLEYAKKNASTSAAALLRSTLSAARSTPQEVHLDPSASSPFTSPSYRLEIVNRILRLGAYGTYSNVADFEWYVDVLIRLAYIAKVGPGAKKMTRSSSHEIGARIRDQLIDVTLRVRAVRAHAVEKLKRVLEDESFVHCAKSDEAELLHAAAWVCGEYCGEVAHPPAIIPLLLRQDTLEKTSSRTQGACIHNAVKLFAWWALDLSSSWSDDMLGEIKSMAKEVSTQLQGYAVRNEDVEVKERATEYRQLFQLLEVDLDSYVVKERSKPEGSLDHGASAGDSNEWSDAGQGKPEEKLQQGAIPPGPKSLHLLSPLFFSYGLGPVAPNAQQKVGVPSGLDLDQWIVEPGTWVLEEDENLTNGKKRTDIGRQEESEGDKREKARLREERLQRQRNNPFYLSDEKVREGPEGLKERDADGDVDQIPIVALQLEGLEFPAEGGERKDQEPSNDGNEGQKKKVEKVQLEEEETPEEPEADEVVKKKVAKKKPGQRDESAVKGKAVKKKKKVVVGLEGN